MSVKQDILTVAGKYHKQLQKLSEPLHQRFGTNHIGYISIDNGGGLINLHTHYAWLEKCIDQCYYINDPSMVNPENIGSGRAFYFTYDVDDFTNGLLKDSIENYDMAHEIVIVRKHENGYDALGITAPKANNKIQNHLLNYSSEFDKFIQYFFQNVSQLTQKLSDDKIDFASLKGAAYHTQKPVIENTKLFFEPDWHIQQPGLAEV